MPSPVSSPFNLLQSRIHGAHLFLDGIEACVNAAVRDLAQYDKPKARIEDVPGYQGIKARVADRQSVANRLRVQSVEYTLHSVYAYLAEYLQELLRALYACDPLAVVGKAPGELKYHEIVAFDSLDAIRDHLVDKVFKRLESTKSTQQLLEKILDHTGVSVPDDIMTSAMMYVEVRHLLVHNAGRIDADFLRRYGGRMTVPTAVGGRFQLSKGMGRSALQSVENLATVIDTSLRARGLLNSTHAAKPSAE